MAYCLSKMYDADCSLLLMLTVDAYGLYSTITNIHGGRHYSLIPAVEMMRDSFESGWIADVQWKKGTKNMADALTKRNPDTSQTQSDLCYWTLGLWYSLWSRESRGRSRIWDRRRKRPLAKSVLARYRCTPTTPITSGFVLFHFRLRILFFLIW